MLTMHNPNTVLQVGKWAQVNKGLYKGDVGLVVEVQPWGVELLLIPRLKPPTSSAANPLKRKRTSIRPEISLFDPDTHKLPFDAKLQRGGFYKCGQLIFEHGLLRKSYDVHSVSSPVVNIPSISIFLFQQSQHYKIPSTFPNPKEWIFEEGESVNILKADTTEPGSGVITAVNPDLLEVDLGTDIRSGEALGVVAVSWHNVRKAVVVGNFIEINCGRHKGTTGWVVEVNDDIIHIVSRLDGGDTASADPSTLLEVSILQKVYTYANLVYREPKLI
jgi:hypothetical protein